MGCCKNRTTSRETIEHTVSRSARASEQVSISFNWLGGSMPSGVISEGTFENVSIDSCNWPFSFDSIHNQFIASSWSMFRPRHSAALSFDVD
jgi:hypothetical protein